MKEYICSLEQLDELAGTFSSKLKKGSVVLLHGELGSGKTTFVKFLIGHLGGNWDDVTSPTFNLVHQYKTARFDVWHFDLYRLKSKEELYNLGVDDALENGISILEWGEIAESLLQPIHTKIFFEYAGDPKVRKVLVENMHC
ncbi:tRNA (adenosine(37)-N6)-threonylcarbamoyltransferase complex ATPase subunit type 1 TsaE [Candidatus Bandiella euplotis]|uniref:tRNA threonylcarbamoyladenosine biosynthesis protein TsaE n=1 Tax=Candidatus Bandiella euplotis TaxID=1664265 RepID=A0ABZ0UME3_9RICK|nr:tRNA (adenosine(37)-N6)-threonylcarbamoyltransferase complex ATPase subunit type 1 TsaE [Candidatus Bandiella woodruffii]WPX97330.1 tRNA threonylcarbamoyladenosine biosynthesis protein TsaE [Candidatus Bandiella woodruffii]